MSPLRVIAAVAALALAAGAIWRRERLGRERMLLALAGAVALGVYASGVFSALPDPEQIVEDLAHTLGAWTYALVGLMAFLETGAFIGFVAPGEVTVIVGGVIAGQGTIDIVPLVGLVWACSLAGDSVSFLIGDRLGREFVLKYGGRLGITAERFEVVERYFDKHGGKTLVIGRSFGFVRPLAPFIAGSSRLPYRRFFPYMVVGTGLWSTTFCLLGYVFWRSFSELKGVIGPATLAFGATVVTIVAVVYAYRRLRDAEQRRRLRAWLDRLAARPALRPLMAVLRPVWGHVLGPAWRVTAPQLRFLWRRLTPGELGIEFTSAVAVTAAGAYVFTLYAVLLSNDPGVTPADDELLRLSDRLYNTTVVDIAKVVTELGSLPVVGALILIAAGLLAWKRRPLELAVLVGGFVVLWVSVQLTKAGVDRTRPPDPLVTVGSASYASGHAAYATAYVVLAVIAARVIPGIWRRAALLLGALVLTAVVGLSRIYLHAHYWSDVVGGWALGFAVFGAAFAIALLVSHIRQNARASRRPPSPPAAASHERR